MRFLFLAVALTLPAGGAVAQEGTQGHEPPVGLGDRGSRSQEQRFACRDRIETVRAERGLPRLRRENAGDGEAKALLFHAIDRDIAGCDVLVMVGDPQDVRPLPEPVEGPLFRLLPGD